jgi:hypothetical protein
MHTKTPISAHDEGFSINDIQIKDAEGTELFWLEDPETANDIVEAVNNHEALIDALQTLADDYKDIVRSEFETHSEPNPEMTAAYKKALRVLKQAQE